MKKITLFLLLGCALTYAQKAKPTYNKTLAQSLNADDYGMKHYVFCLLKTGKNTTATDKEKEELFKGHMANIKKLSEEGKLTVAGPFMENDREYRGIFIFNVATIEEAQALVASDPAVKAGIFEAELTPWYSSAALQEVPKIHEQIAKSKF